MPAKFDTHASSASAPTRKEAPRIAWTQMISVKNPYPNASNSRIVPRRAEDV